MDAERTSSTRADDIASNARLRNQKLKRSIEIRPEFFSYSIIENIDRKRVDSGRSQLLRDITPRLAGAIDLRKSHSRRPSEGDRVLQSSA
jgi:hypothetical protein